MGDKLVNGWVKHPQNSQEIWKWHRFWKPATPWFCEAEHFVSSNPIDDLSAGRQNIGESQIVSVFFGPML